MSARWALQENEKARRKGYVPCDGLTEVVSCDLFIGDAGKNLRQSKRPGWRAKGNPFLVGRPKGICRRSPVGENREFLERSGENSRHIGGKAPCGKNPPR